MSLLPSYYVIVVELLGIICNSLVPSLAINRIPLELPHEIYNKMYDLIHMLRPANWISLLYNY